MKRVLFALFAAVLFCGSAALAQTTISQYGISVTFAENRSVGAGNMGQFATGDYWVVGPVTLTNITPGHTTINDGVVSGRVINGAMVNPTPTYWPTQGFDSRIQNYSSSLNMAIVGGSAVSVGNPRTISNGSSLCLSTGRSTNDPNAHALLNDFAVITVLASAPPAGSFRPPYVGTDKTIRWNVADLDYTILKNLDNVAGYGSPTAGGFTRPWVEIATNYNTARDFRPMNNQPEYERDMGFAYAGAFLPLHINNTNATKQLGYARLVQYGIDVYASVKYGVYSGHPVINETPLSHAAIVLAALALNDTDMKWYANAANKTTLPWWTGPVNRWGIDLSHFYVTQSDVGKTVAYDPPEFPRVTYSQQHVGLPEWGGEHEVSWPSRDDSRWGAKYRDVRYSSMSGPILGMQLTTGARQLWNWQATFDFYDRAFPIYSTAPNGQYSEEDPTLTHVKTMWTAYRSLGGPIWSQSGADTTPPTVAINSPTSGATYSTTSGSFSIGGTASDNVGLTSVTAAMTGATTGAISISGTTSWSGTAIINGGVTVITVTATDSSGNTATDVLTVTRNGTITINGTLQLQSLTISP